MPDNDSRPTGYYYLLRFDGYLWSTNHGWHSMYTPSYFTESTANELCQEFNNFGTRCVVVRDLL